MFTVTLMDGNYFLYFVIINNVTIMNKAFLFVSIGYDLCLERRFLEDLLDQNPRHIGRQLFPACFHKDPLRTKSIG